MIKKMEQKLTALNNNLTSQIIYLLCNIANGDEKQRAMLMESNIIKLVACHLVFILYKITKLGR